jgi:trk system potassium uptake protein TrkA
LDVLCVKGSGASVSVLQEASIARTDLLIAATSSDEMNMVCCLLGRKLGAKHTIARIRDPEYAEDLDMLREELGLTMIINPEEAAAKEIGRVLRLPHAHSIDTFANGRVEMVGFRVLPTDPIVDQRLAEAVRHMPGDVLFCAVEHEGELVIPNGETVLYAADVVHIIGQPPAMLHFFKYMGRTGNKVRDVLIVGGGRIARYLARDLLANDMSVKIIEINEAKAVSLSADLPDALVIQDDGTDLTVLETEGLAQMDAFVALTDRDEENLMIALHAHQRAVPKVIAKINRVFYTNIIRRLGVDSVVSPKLLVADRIVRYVRARVNAEGSAIKALTRIAQDQAEALEFEAGAHSRLVGQPLRSLPFKEGVLIAVVVRNKRIMIPHGDQIIQAGDHVIAVARRLTVTDLDDLLEA